VPAAGQDQREREVGDGRIEDAGGVRHRDPALAARCDVHGVVAGAVVGDEPQVGEEVELLRADPHDDRDQYLDAGQRPCRRPCIE
jgi:hypothetical protein